MSFHLFWCRVGAYRCTGMTMLEDRLGIVKDNIEALRRRGKNYRIGAAMSTVGALIFGSMTYAYYRMTGTTEASHVLFTGAWTSLLILTLSAYRKNEYALKGHEYIKDTIEKSKKNY